MNPYTTVTKIGWHSLHWFLTYGVHKLFGPLPAVTLTFWPQKPMSTSMSPLTSVTKFGWNYLHCFMRYSLHKIFGSLAAVTFDLWPQKPNQHIYEPKNICDHNWVKFPSLVFVIWCWQGFQHAQTHSFTHGRTDPNTVCLLHCFSTAQRHKNRHHIITLMYRHTTFKIWEFFCNWWPTAYRKSASHPITSVTHFESMGSSALLINSIINKLSPHITLKTLNNLA